MSIEHPAKIILLGNGDSPKEALLRIINNKFTKLLIVTKHGDYKILTEKYKDAITITDKLNDIDEKTDMVVIDKIVPDNKDDLAKITELWLLSRVKKITMIYIHNNLMSLPKPIRMNATCLILTDEILKK